MKNEMVARLFIAQTIRAFDVEVVKFKGEAHKFLDYFHEAAEQYYDNAVEFQGVAFWKYMYDYGVYNLYVFYYGSELVVVIVDGDVGSYAVVNETLWDQNIFVN